MNDLQRLVGKTDIYLLDQILRGRIPEGCRIFDAGLGGARNLVYFLQQGYEVSGVDSNPGAIAEAQRLASDHPASNFRHETLEKTSFEAASFDVVISSAVLHFASDEEHFEAMLLASWNLLRPGGLFFCRLASKIGLDPAQLLALGKGRYRLPDGSQRYLVDETRLLALTEQLGALQLDPLKTTVVQGLRAMTTWVVRKNGP